MFDLCKAAVSECHQCYQYYQRGDFNLNRFGHTPGPMELLRPPMTKISASSVDANRNLNARAQRSCSFQT